MEITKSSNSKALTAAFVKNVNVPGKYHDGKGTGLFLLVKKSGRRSFVQRLTIRGKRHDIGLGAPPFVTLAEAREQAFENKRLALKGRDPLAEKARARETPTFEDAARQAHLELSPTWKNPKDRKAFLSTLENYIFPRFGSVPLPDVTSADVRRAILAVRATAPGIARKLVYRVSSVFKWGIAEGHCENNPATTQALALPRETRAVQHRKSLPYSEVSGCIETVTASRAWIATKLALEFIALTACRSGEARLARWDEVDLTPCDTATCATWTIPADRSKSGRPHIVPLSRRAIEILREAEELKDGSDLVFPSLRGKPLSDMCPGSAPVGLIKGFS
ncbi:tyrosine-type recombinase/integrase [Ovoidimarina sediminis]|uniref:tyrosine-type recombinase/integrase n=1 Tax=Ovoidimarina sediminis TaxID=3079856 RepID=UPI002910F47B|nr:integrase arm-type DNA-binding domain-containing protein [Rhodophyticola sp. MJ-SS7]MDU8945302.1 integrase arm-type DNA-binding domain-containing protein [Rhodophyticola sp. MJ-SS7]